MKISKLNIIIALLSCFAATISAQEKIDFKGKIAFGKNAKISANLNLKSNAELYFFKNSLVLNGDFSAENGAKIFLMAHNLSNGVLKISGTANGTVEIVPALFDDLSSADLEVARAKKANSNENAFIMQHIDYQGCFADLQHSTDGDETVWKITKSLPLIAQLGNHTLLVNNNFEQNGGHTFVNYRWFKNGQIIKEGTQNNYGGSYFTGGENLDNQAQYWAEVEDENGQIFSLCKFQPTVRSSAMQIKAFPNPVRNSNFVNVEIDAENIADLQNATIDLYSIEGKFMSKTNVANQRILKVYLPSKSGVYLLKFYSQNICKTLKINVIQ